MNKTKTRSSLRCWMKMVFHRGEAVLGKLKDKLEKHLHLHDHPVPDSPNRQEGFQHSGVSSTSFQAARASELFPEANNTAASKPSGLWSPEIRTAPLPTNTFWLNYILKDGSQPEYIHPYLVQSTPGSLSLCYPKRIVNSAFIIQAFTPDVTISHGRGNVQHAVSHYDDLSVTLEVPGKGVKVPLVRGCPYVTMVLKDGYYGSNAGAPLVISTVHAVLDLKTADGDRKHRLLMNNGQTWVIYTSSAVQFDMPEGPSVLRSKGTVRNVVVRIALVPNGDENSEQVLDKFAGKYPVGGHARFPGPFRIGYEFKSKGNGELLMLNLPLHRETLSGCSSSVKLTYDSIDGPLEGIVGDSWSMQETPVPATWHSSKGLCDDSSREMIARALDKDVAALSSISTTSSYFYGKAAARAARLALIAEEIGQTGVLDKLRSYLAGVVTPWLDGSFTGNAIVYDREWGGLITGSGSHDAGADFGMGVYNDHHYHWGYFVYASAVLAKLDAQWASRFRQHIYALVEDYMTFREKEHAEFPRLRCFDVWLMHSWAGGLTEFADGRNQESTSEAVNAYYAAAMVGMVYGDVTLVNHSMTLVAMEARTGKALWHIPAAGSSIYESEFSRDNRFVGVLWANKRDTGLWFAGAEARECRLGIQVLPITPVTELLFGNATFARAAVDWAWPRVQLNSVSGGWKGFVYAVLAAAGDTQQALNSTMALQEHDDGNSLTNMLWWILSR